MTNLPAIDRVCFNCSLEDCAERNKDCKRRKFTKEKKNYKEEIHRKKMTTTLKRQDPIIVR